MITTTLSHQSPTTGYQNHFQPNYYYKSVHTTLKSACFLDCCIQGCHTFCYHTLFPRDQGLPAGWGRGCFSPPVPQGLSVLTGRQHSSWFLFFCFLLEFSLWMSVLCNFISHTLYYLHCENAKITQVKVSTRNRVPQGQPLLTDHFVLTCSSLSTSKEGQFLIRSSVSKGLSSGIIWVSSCSQWMWFSLKRKAPRDLERYQFYRWPLC